MGGRERERVKLPINCGQGWNEARLLFLPKMEFLSVLTLVGGRYRCVQWQVDWYVVIIVLIGGLQMRIVTTAFYTGRFGL